VHTDARRVGSGSGSSGGSGERRGLMMQKVSGWWEVVVRGGVGR